MSQAISGDIVPPEQASPVVSMSNRATLDPSASSGQKGGNAMTPRVPTNPTASGGGPSRMILLGIALAGASCAQTRETRSVKEAGFLRDYSELREGEGDEA